MTALVAALSAVLLFQGARGPADGGAGVDAKPAADARADVIPLEPAEVSRIVRSRQGPMKACYEHALKNDRRLAGRLVLRWTITSTGDVARAGVEDDTLGDRALAACMVERVSRLKFAPTGSGSIDVSFPFVFQPNDRSPSARAAPATGRPAPEPRLQSVLVVGRDKLSVMVSGIDQRNEGQIPHLEMIARRARRASAPVTLDLTPAAYPELAAVLQPSFSWTLGSSALDLGPRRVARLGLSGRAGEDLTVVQEIAILVALDGDPGDPQAPGRPRILWVGLGDRRESQFGDCAIDTRASFTLSAEGKLERQARSKRSVSTPSKNDDPDAAGRRKECKAPPPRTDLFPLAPP